MQFNFAGWGFWRGGSCNQTDELMADSLQGRISSRDSARVSHHPLVVLPVDGDRFLLDDGVGDLMEVTEHVPALVLLFLLGALLLAINFVLLGLASLFGDDDRLPGKRSTGA